MSLDDLHNYVSMAEECSQFGCKLFTSQGESVTDRSDIHPTKHHDKNDLKKHFKKKTDIQQSKI